MTPIPFPVSGSGEVDDEDGDGEEPLTGSLKAQLNERKELGAEVAKLEITVGTELLPNFFDSELVLSKSF